MAVVEIVTFRLAPGADERAFLDADYRVQTEFVPHRHGFVRRTTARGADGSWATVQLWGSAADADAADADLVAGEDDAATAFVALVDLVTRDRRCFTLLD